MKISDALKSIVSQTVINNVLDGATTIRLDLISQDDTTARSKYGVPSFPTIDSALVQTQFQNVFSKTGSDDLTFPINQAKQIARSNAVNKGTLDPSLEFDTSLDWSDSRISNEIGVDEFFSIAPFHFFVDITANDGTIFRATTSPRDVTIPDGYYGNLGTTSTTYQASSLVLNIGDTNNSLEKRIDDGSATGGLYLNQTLSGLVLAAQQRKLVNANVLFRMCMIKDAKTYLGPVRVGNTRVDGVTHSVDVDSQKGLVHLQLIKTWDQITNTFGVKAQYADHNARFPTDNFLRYVDNTIQTFTWKQT